MTFFEAFDVCRSTAANDNDARVQTLKLFKPRLEKAYIFTTANTSKMANEHEQCRLSINEFANGRCLFIR